MKKNNRPTRPFWCRNGSAGVKVRRGDGTRQSLGDPFHVEPRKYHHSIDQSIGLRFRGQRKATPTPSASTRRHPLFPSRVCFCQQIDTQPMEMAESGGRIPRAGERAAQCGTRDRRQNSATHTHTLGAAVRLRWPIANDWRVWPFTWHAHRLPFAKVAYAIPRLYFTQKKTMNPSIGCPMDQTAISNRKKVLCASLTGNLVRLSSGFYL